MKLFNFWDRYLVDKEFKVTICDDKVYILNYLEVEDFSSTRVVVRYEGGSILLFGDNLVVSKMEEEDLLIVGRLKSIEYN